MCTPVSWARGGWGLGATRPLRPERNTEPRPRSGPLQLHSLRLPRCPERGPRSEAAVLPQGGQDGPPCRGAPGCQRPCVGGQPTVLTLRAPHLDPAGWASCPSCLRQPLALALGHAGCWRGDSGHGQSASLCPGLVSDFTLSQGPHVSCVRLSGDESPGAGHPEPTHQRAPQPASPRPCPRLSVWKGRPAAGTCAFFRPAPSSSPGKKETRPSVAETGWRGSPALCGAGAGAGPARVLWMHGSI